MLWESVSMAILAIEVEPLPLKFEYDPEVHIKQADEPAASSAQSLGSDNDCDIQIYYFGG